MSEYDTLKESEAFRQWFWTGTNGNNLINFLNSKQTGTCDTLRREADPPRIYFIIVDLGYKYGNDDWKLVKVGFTQRDSTSNNLKGRISIVEKQIQSKVKIGVTVQCGLKPPIKATDTGNLSEIEDRMREYFGIYVPPEKLKPNPKEDPLLPVHTEWVITTAKYIDYVKEARKKCSDYYDTEIISNNKFNHSLITWQNGKQTVKDTGKRDEIIDGLIAAVRPA